MILDFSSWGVKTQLFLNWVQALRASKPFGDPTLPKSQLNLNSVFSGFCWEGTLCRSGFSATASTRSSLVVVPYLAVVYGGFRHPQLNLNSCFHFSTPVGGGSACPLSAGGRSFWLVPCSSSQRFLNFLCFDDDQTRTTKNDEKSQEVFGVKMSGGIFYGRGKPNTALGCYRLDSI